MTEPIDRTDTDTDTEPDDPDTDAVLHRLHPLSPLLRGGVVVVAVAIAGLRQLVDGQTFDRPVLLLVPGIALVVGWAAVSWWTTRYRLSPTTLRVETGVLMHRSRRIRLDRVQSVEVRQPLVARLFGMSELHIETAGGDTEASLAYLTLGQAQQLRQDLLARASAQTGPVTPGDGLAPARHVLHRVPAGLLLASQLARTGPVLSILAAGVGVTVSVLLGQPFGLALLIPAGIAVAAAIWSGFVAQYGFTLSRTDRGLGLRAGLLDVRTQSVPADRVQGVVVLEPLLWRRFNWCEVQVTVAGVRNRADEDVRLTATLVPVASRDLAERLVDEVLVGRGRVPTQLAPPPDRVRFLDPLARRVLGARLSSQLVVTRRGWLTRRTDVVPRHKVQSCALRQGPLQRRLRLASVTVHLPVGPVNAIGVHRDQAEAWRSALTLATAVH